MRKGGKGERERGGSRGCGIRQENGQIVQFFIAKQSLLCKTSVQEGIKGTLIYCTVVLGECQKVRECNIIM